MEVLRHCGRSSLFSKVLYNASVAAVMMALRAALCAEFTRGVDGQAFRAGFAGGMRRFYGGVCRRAVWLLRLARPSPTG